MYLSLLPRRAPSTFAVWHPVPQVTQKKTIETCFPACIRIACTSFSSLVPHRQSNFLHASSCKLIPLKFLLLNSQREEIRKGFPFAGETITTAVNNAQRSRGVQQSAGTFSGRSRTPRAGDLASLCAVLQSMLRACVRGTFAHFAPSRDFLSLETTWYSKT